MSGDVNEIRDYAPHSIVNHYITEQVQHFNYERTTRLKLFAIAQAAAISSREVKISK